jgi:HK97 family phage portal protein
MAWYSTFFGFFTGNSTGQYPGGQLSSPSVAAHDDTPTVGIDPALQISTVWACVTLIVENIASLPMHLYIKDGEGRRLVENTDRPYMELHNTLTMQPNTRQTTIEFWEVMLLNYVLRGNAYAIIQRNVSGKVVALHPLAADQVKVEAPTDPRGDLIYTYHFNGFMMEYRQDEILHIRGMGNGNIGLSPLDYMRSSAGLSIKSQNHLQKTFRKDGKRAGVLYTGGHILTPPQREAARKKFNDIANGKADSSTDTGAELHILEGDFKYEPLGMSPADIQLLETRKFSVQDLARWFGVPSILINDTGETTSLGSSVEQIIDGFYKLKLRTILERIEKAIELRVFSPQERAAGLCVEFNMDALLRSSLKERMEVYAQASQNGIFTRNECREYENLPPKDGGDMLTAQSNLLPLDKLGMQTTSGGAVPPDPIKQ